MPQIHVPQRANTAEITYTVGAQYVDGALTLGDGATIQLSADVYTQTGKYLLFDYGPSGTLTGDLSKLNVNTDALGLSGGYEFLHDTANKKVYLKLKSRADNGKQFVDGDLTLADGAVIRLSAELYATPNTYELFEFTGTGNFTTSGGTPNYLTNVTISVQKRGLRVQDGRAFLEESGGVKMVKVTLI